MGLSAAEEQSEENLTPGISGETEARDGVAISLSPTERRRLKQTLSGAMNVSWRGLLCARGW